MSMSNSNNNKFKTIKEIDIKEFIGTALNIKKDIITNHTICTLKSGNIISIFGDRIIQGKVDGLYVIIIKDFAKKDEWVYDFSTAIVVYLDSVKISAVEDNTPHKIIIGSKQYNFNVSAYINQIDNNIKSKPKDLGNKKLYGGKYDEFNTKLVEPSTDFKSLARPYEKFTGREYACIHMKVPNSGNNDLDILIEEARQRDISDQIEVSNYFHR